MNLKVSINISSKIELHLEEFDCQIVGHHGLNVTIYFIQFNCSLEFVQLLLMPLINLFLLTVMRHLSMNNIFLISDFCFFSFISLPIYKKKVN